MTDDPEYDPLRFGPENVARCGPIVEISTRLPAEAIAVLLQCALLLDPDCEQPMLDLSEDWLVGVISLLGAPIPLRVNLRRADA